MQFTSILSVLVLAASCAVEAAPSPAPEAWCGDHHRGIPCFSKRDAEAKFSAIARRDANAAAEAWCGDHHRGIPCFSKRHADAFYEATMVTKREAESAPEALAAAWCGDHHRGIPCFSKRAAEAIAEAHAEAESSAMPLPSPAAFAEAWCGQYGNEAACDTKRAAEAVPEALCGEQQCNAKREAILRREYSALLALQKL